MIEKIKPEVIAKKDKLFKPTAYDIRAYVGVPGDFFSKDAVLTPDVTFVIGLLMGGMTFVCADNSTVRLRPGNSVVVGYDNGPTSGALADGFISGLRAQGINVFDIGISSSGQVYHNMNQLGANGYVQITRSHVEVTTNGAKFGIGTQGIHTFLLKQMGDAVGKGEIEISAPAGMVFNKSDEGYACYAEKMIARYGEYFKEHPRDIAINLFGGTGVKYKELFKRIFGDGVRILGANIDVNHSDLLADPTRIEMLCRVPDIQSTLQSGYRIHSFDLDADRGSITEGKTALQIGGEGHYLGPDLAYLIADYKLTIAVPRLFMALSKHNIGMRNLDEIHKIATTIYIDPRYTGGVEQFIITKGGTPQYHPKGHSLWKETLMANMNKMAKLAGCSDLEEFMEISEGYRDTQMEASLHFFITDPQDGIARDDAIENVFFLESVLDMLKINSLQSYYKGLNSRFSTKEIRTNSMSNEIKEGITARVINSIKRTFTAPRFTIIEYDGMVRVNWDTGFIMYGMSNTSPKLTFMAEGSTIRERNNALYYVFALHNEAKFFHGDETAFDTAENADLINDPSYSIENPDDISMGDLKVTAFLNKMEL